MFINKWLVCACAIACILAYYGEDQDADMARGNSQPVSCTASAAAGGAGGPSLSVAEAERQCSAVRNTQRHRQG